MEANIVSIKRFAVHDGDGIRTTVFFKGCPLACRWCHNPECISGARQIGFYVHKCVFCGRCADVCPSGCHKIGEREGKPFHSFDREKCSRCGKCAEVCPESAIEVYGKSVGIAALAGELIKDKPFFDSSGGGVTVSGGEPLVQSDAVAELLKTIKAAGVSTAVDTCGDVTRDAIEKVLPYADVFLYDVKAIDPDVHKKCTGRDNARILDNLRFLGDAGAPVEIRIPFVPEFNDREIDGIVKFVAGIKSVRAVRILPYHDYARAKYAALGLGYGAESARVPEKEETKKATDYAEKLLSVVRPDIKVKR